MLKFAMAKFHIIIPAAGSGSRMGLGQPKQYLKIHKQTFIERVLRVFQNIHSLIQFILRFTQTMKSGKHLTYLYHQSLVFTIVVVNLEQKQYLIH